MSRKVLTGLCTSILILFSASAISQTTGAHEFVLSFGGSAGLPTGAAVTNTKYILGADFRLQYGLTDRVAVMFTTGGSHFFAKDHVSGGFGVGPLKLGVKGFFLPHFYVSGEVGTEYEFSTEGYTGNHKLLLSPAVGYANNHWDFGIKFENYSADQSRHFGQSALHIAYGFKL